MNVNGFQSKALAATTTNVTRENEKDVFAGGDAHMVCDTQGLL